MTTAAKYGGDIRARLGHPVVDCDGHQLEFEPLLIDYIRSEGGNELVKTVEEPMAKLFHWYECTPQQRKAGRLLRPPWGLQTRSAKDIATCMLPSMLYERLDEIGIDLSIQYPTLGIGLVRFSPPESCGAVARAVNRYYHDQFQGYGDRLIPVAVIPMQHPDTAIRELEYAVSELGHKAVVMSGCVPRLVEEAEALVDELPSSLLPHLRWMDTFGLDSAYDYDPLWKRCIELRVSLSAHHAGFWGARRSPSNYVHNHLGAFAEGSEAVCKSLFMGGVTFRFPELRVGLLEGGVGWAASLFAGLIEHWEKRSYKRVLEDFHPDQLDSEALWEALAKVHGDRFASGPILETFPMLSVLSGWNRNAGWEQGAEVLDEFRHCKIESPEDIRDHFVQNFFFGCEAEDAGVFWAFNKNLNPCGSKLRAMFGSDIGHWDVPDIRGVLCEAFELVEQGLSPEGFKEFMFENSVLYHGTSRADFFDGTIIEEQARAVIESSSS